MVFVFVFCFVILTSYVATGHSESCVNLSGTYAFRGFDRATDCDVQDTALMLLTPLPLGKGIYANDRIHLEQKGCSALTVIYNATAPDTSNTEVRRPVDLNSANFTANGITSSTSQFSPMCAMGGCVFTRNSTSWSLALDEHKDLKFGFRYSSTGLLNFTTPYSGKVKAQCLLLRVQ